MRQALLAASLTLAALPGQAMAQPAVGTPAPAAASAPAASASGNKRFGEFIVRCAQGKSVAPCDLYEERGDKNTGERLIGFSIGYMPSTARYIMQIAVPLGVGLAIGTGLALWAGRAAGALLFGLKPYDPAALASAIVLLAVVALTASYWPAFRASRVEPMSALREE